MEYFSTILLPSFLGTKKNTPPEVKRGSFTASKAPKKKPDESQHTADHSSYSLHTGYTSLQHGQSLPANPDSLIAPFPQQFPQSTPTHPRTPKNHNHHGSHGWKNKATVWGPMLQGTKISHLWKRKHISSTKTVRVLSWFPALAQGTPWYRAHVTPEYRTPQAHTHTPRWRSPRTTKVRRILMVRPDRWTIERSQRWKQWHIYIYLHISLGGGWTNPSEKYKWNWIISPRIGVKIKNMWNHHLDQN